MKKFGLRALAGGMAALMVASVFAPASVANAADVLLIAPAPTSEKVLYVTEDMVDEDGEIVISGGTYDRVVVSKEAAANDIYFDQVEIGDLVVESGSKTNIQLWEVDAEKLTVKEPELENITLSDLRTLLTDDATRQKALDLFVESQAKDARTLKNAPKIVTKEDAKVETLVARANAKLDLGEGEVGVVALEASNELRRADVTLSNYNGDVTYKGGDAYSVMNLKNVDSRIKSLTVEESTAVNHLNVTAKNAVVLEATVSGNAKVSLNAPMGTVEITEDATEADVCIFNAAEELNVKADGAKVELAPNGSVVLAKVTSDDVKITGKGSLTEADLDGKGAYVTISGAKVDGENTYVPPVYVPPVEEPYDSWSEDFSDAELVSGVPTDGASMNWATYRYDAEGGYGVATTKDGWEGFAVLLDNRDNGSYADYVVTLKAKKLGGVTSAVRVSENLPDNSWPAHAAVTTIGEEWVTIKTNKINVAAGEKRIILIVPENGASGVTMELAVDDIKVERYTEWTVAKGPEISTETYTIAETFTKNAGSFKARGTATAIVKEGALYVSGRTANWHGVEISLNKEKTIGRTLNVSFKVKYDDDTAGTVKSTLNTSSSAYTPVTETAIAKEDGWITVTETMTVPADAEYVTYYFEAVSTTASFYIDDVVISTEEITEDMLTEPEGGDDNIPTEPEVEGDTYTFAQFGDEWYMDPTGVSYTIENGSAVIDYTEQYKAVQFGFNWLIPDTTGYSKMIINYEAPKGGIIVKAWQKGEAPDANYNSQIMGNGNTSATAANLELDITGATASIEKVDIMSASTGEYTVKVNSITFVKEEGKEPEGVTPKTYDFTNLAMWYKDGATSEVVDGVMSVTYEGQYKMAQYAMPTDINTMDYTKMVFNVVSPDGKFALKVWEKGEVPGEGNSCKITQYVDPVATAIDIEVDISDATNVIEKVDFMSTKDAGDGAYPYTLTVNSITFK